MRQHYSYLIMMMMNCFCSMVDQRKGFSLIFSRDHCQRSSPSRIFPHFSIFSHPSKPTEVKITPSWSIFKLRICFYLLNIICYRICYPNLFKISIWFLKLFILKTFISVQASSTACFSKTFSLLIFPLLFCNLSVLLIDNFYNVFW